MDIMMSMRDRGNTDRTKDKANFLPRRDSRPSGACRASQMQSIDHCTPTLTIGSKILTLDQQTAADGEGGTPRSCTVHATARLHTRIRQRSSSRRRGLPKSFGLRRIQSGLRIGCPSFRLCEQSKITQTSPFDQMGRCSGQNGSTRRAN